MFCNSWSPFYCHFNLFCLDFVVLLWLIVICSIFTLWCSHFAQILNTMWILIVCVHCMCFYVLSVSLSSLIQFFVFFLSFFSFIFLYSCYSISFHSKYFHFPLSHDLIHMVGLVYCSSPCLSVCFVICLSLFMLFSFVLLLLVAWLCHTVSWSFFTFYRADSRELQIIF